MPSTVSRPGSRPGLKPRRTQRRTNHKQPRKDAGSSKVKVVGYVDQHGAKWLRVGLNGKWAFATRSELVGDRSEFFKRLERQDVAILIPKLQNSVVSKAQVSNFKKKGHVVDRLGWHGTIYIRPDSALPKTIDGARTIDARDLGAANWATGGSLKQWRKGVRRFVDGQALPTFVLGCAFASFIQHLVPSIDDNVGFELFHLTSIGKSKLLILAGSVFGPPKSYRRTWSTTVNALEQTIALRGDALLLLDEENLFLDATPKSYEQFGLAVHKLAAGSEKARFDNPSGRDHRFVFLSNANMPLREVVKAIGEPRIQAVEVRMPTIPADAGHGFGVFDQLPEGCEDGAKAIEELTLCFEAHYGWAAPAFIEAVECRLGTATGRRRLIERIQRYMSEFKRRAGISGNDGAANRVVDKFALVYAAAALARRWKIAPLTRPRSAVLTVYRRYRAGLPAVPVTTQGRSAINEVRNYESQYRTQLHDLTNGSYPTLTDLQLNAAHGFLLRKGGATWLMVRAQRWNAQFGARANTMLQELKSAGKLKATDGNQWQTKVRKLKSKDRVYCIQLN